MANNRLIIKAPARVPDDAGVKLTISYTPTDELRQELVALRFGQFGYPDERLGRVGTLTQAVAATEASKNPVYQLQLASERAELALIGDPLAHARVYEPDAVSVRVVSGPAARHNAKLVQFQGDWAIWAPVTLEVTS